MQAPIHQFATKITRAVMTTTSTAINEDEINDVSMILYCDADFASGLKCSKSTSGGHVALFGPNTFLPLAEVCKKQTVVSHRSDIKSF